MRYLSHSPSNLESTLGLRLAMSKLDVLGNYSFLGSARFFVDLSVCQAFQHELRIMGLEMDNVCQLTAFSPSLRTILLGVNAGSDYTPTGDSSSALQTVAPTLDSSWIHPQFANSFSEGTYGTMLSEFFAEHHYALIEGTITGLSIQVRSRHILSLEFMNFALLSLPLLLSSFFIFQCW